MEAVTKAVPKFKICFLGRTIRQRRQLPQLKEWCRLFHENGLVPSYGRGSYGNLSFRCVRGKNEFIVTTSALELKDKLSQRHFFEVKSVDTKKKLVSGYGQRPPSSETQLHKAIYCARRDVNAIFHGHSAAILSAAKKLRIPGTRREEPYGTLRLVNGVLRVLEKHSFIVMKNHGFISMGQTMAEAGRAALKIQKEALKI